MTSMCGCLHVFDPITGDSADWLAVIRCWIQTFSVRRTTLYTVVNAHRYSFSLVTISVIIRRWFLTSQLPWKVLFQPIYYRLSAYQLLNMSKNKGD
jgi:hypothetical protein